MTADTDLVVMTMGGNDLGFRHVVQRCFGPNTWFALAANPGDCRQYAEKLEDGLQDVANRLTGNGDEDVFEAIMNKLGPGGKIAYLSYPHLQVDDGYAIASSIPGLGQTDVFPAGREIRRIAVKADDLIRLGVEDFNSRRPGNPVIFVDTIKQLFAGHEPDADGSNPNRWIFEVAASQSD